MEPVYYTAFKIRIEILPCRESNSRKSFAAIENLALKSSLSIVLIMIDNSDMVADKFSESSVVSKVVNNAPKYSTPLGSFPREIQL